MSSQKYEQGTENYPTSSVLASCALSCSLLCEGVVIWTDQGDQVVAVVPV